MQLNLTQDTRHFQCNGIPYIARTIQPCCGTMQVIREWGYLPRTSAVYKPCADAQILRLEKALGEWPKIKVINHPALGRVATPVGPYDVKAAAEHMDWQQVVLNGGPPCFHLEADGSFCGRAERWHGDDTHPFRALHTIL